MQKKTAKPNVLSSRSLTFHVSTKATKVELLLLKHLFRCPTGKVRILSLEKEWCTSFYKNNGQHAGGNMALSFLYLTFVTWVATTIGQQYRWMSSNKMNI